MTYTVVDNYLTIEDLNSIKKRIDEVDFPWFYLEHVGYEDDFSDYYFRHTFFKESVITSNFLPILEPIIKKLDIKALIRCRILRFIGREKFIEHGRHTDFNFSHKVCVFYLNTNNGFTRMNDSTCVNSVANRALFFDGSLEHNSTNCTDQKSRLVLAINYF